MAKLRKIEDELEAWACLAVVDAAGVPAAAWARSHGIDGRSLNAWRVNLSRSSPGPRRTRKRRAPRASTGPIVKGLVELVAAPSTAITSRYAVRVGGIAVEFGDDFREDTLRRVIGLLHSC